jgi:hypothetical protein
MIFLILLKIILVLIFMLIIGKLIGKFGDLFNLKRSNVYSNDFFSMLIFSIFIVFLLFYIIPYLIWTLLGIVVIFILFFYLFKNEEGSLKGTNKLNCFVFWVSDKYNYYLKQFSSYQKSNYKNFENITYIAGEHFIGQEWYKTSIEKSFYLYGDAKIKLAVFESIFNLAGSINAEKCEFEDEVEIISSNVYFKKCQFNDDIKIIIPKGFKEEDLNIIFLNCVFKKNIFFKGISDFKLDKSNNLKGSIEYI